MRSNGCCVAIRFMPEALTRFPEPEVSVTPVGRCQASVAPEKT